MFISVTLGALAVLSLVLTVWQFLAARLFPLHQRRETITHTPPVTLLKPLKGVEPDTAGCLKSWLTQNYAGEIQILFGVAAETDPACPVVQKLLAEFPKVEAALVVCPESLGANAKVSTLIQLQRRAKHDVVVVSDADVWAPADFLSNAVAPLQDSAVGLVNCFYRLANPSTVAMKWEAVAINADFWSQVLQSCSLKPMDFALGAVMLTRRRQLAEIGGFESVANYLADDYRLGNQIARKNYRIEICPVVVECRSAPMTWADVWKHQLRWSRTIRVCQPAPYFFSIVSNGSLWPLLWLISTPTQLVAASAALCLSVRICSALALQYRLTQSKGHLYYDWLVLVKDLLQVALWGLAFLGSTILWRGQRYRVERGGELVKLAG